MNKKEERERIYQQKKKKVIERETGRESERGELQRQRKKKGKK